MHGVTDKVYLLTGVLNWKYLAWYFCLISVLILEILVIFIFQNIVVIVNTLSAR